MAIQKKNYEMVELLLNHPKINVNELLILNAFLI